MLLVSIKYNYMLDWSYVQMSENLRLSQSHKNEYKNECIFVVIRK